MSWYVNPFMESIFIADDPFTVVSEDQISPTTHWTVTVQTTLIPYGKNAEI